jgi:hypothetical protein
MARLLVTVDVKKGLAAHIADAAGKPLCHAELNLTLWRVQDRSAEGLVVCRNCRLRAVKKSSPSRELSFDATA